MSVSGISQRQLAWPAQKSHPSVSPFQPQADRFQSQETPKTIRPTTPQFGGNWLTWDSITHGAAPENADADPAFKPVEKTNPEKLKIAQELNDWLLDTLRKKDVQVAVIARNGSPQVQQHDPTGMAHSGIVVRCPEDEHGWHVYNLINHIQGSEPQAGIFKSTITDFFYEQSGLKKDALLLIPPKDIQHKMQAGIQNGDYKKLFFTRDYNLVSAPFSTRSLNCNKWALMNILAAHKQSYQPADILKTIQESFQPGVVNVHPILRPFAKRQPIIIGDEVPAWAPIHTVSVESLYHSGLFEEKHFYNQRELVKKPPEPSSAMRTYGPIIGGAAVVLPLLYFTLKLAGRRDAKAIIQRAILKYLFKPAGPSRP